jgi:hypothetical protein
VARWDIRNAATVISRTDWGKIRDSGAIVNSQAGAATSGAATLALMNLDVRRFRGDGQFPVSSANFDGGKCGAEGGRLGERNCPILIRCAGLTLLAGGSPSVHILWCYQYNSDEPLPLIIEDSTTNPVSFR